MRRFKGDYNDPNEGQMEILEQEYQAKQRMDAQDQLEEMHTREYGGFHYRGKHYENEEQ